MNNVIVTEKAWGLMRHLFSERQKDMLRQVKAGDVICPRGVLVNTDRLPPILKEKFQTNLKKANKMLANKDKR